MKVQIFWKGVLARQLKR